MLENLIIGYQTKDENIYAVRLIDLRLIVKQQPIPISVKRFFEEGVTIRSISLTK